MLRYVITACFCCTATLLLAQSNWELPTITATNDSTTVTSKGEKKQNNNSARDNTAIGAKKKATVPNEEDIPYLAGAVPEEDGKIVFSAVIETPQLSAEEAYDRMYKYMEQLAAEKQQTDKSHIAIVDKTNHSIVGTYVERLTLSKRFLELDVTDFGYTMIVTCSDSTVSIRIERLYFIYTAKKTPEHMTAEATISDNVMLTKDGTRLRKYNSRFRRVTVDRMRAILAACRTALSE